MLRSLILLAAIVSLGACHRAAEPPAPQANAAALQADLERQANALDAQAGAAADRNAADALANGAELPAGNAAQR